jgi:FMN-dependent oxidoreductase (nitrilotriacetate monooxygenase family)
MRRQMHLGAFLFNLGNHIAGWRMPGVPADGLMSFDFYRDLAQIAEAGKFDFLFHSDGVGINDTYDAVLRHSITIRPEPLTLLSALAVVTTRIGLAATVSTTYNEPYTIARTLAMLDFLSNGRAAANLVTSSTDQEAQNFGRPRHMDHATRYARAGEFAAILRKLWDSWEDGAVILDRESGVVADPARIHAIHWEGEFFSVRGPLNMPRPPQGHPVIIQAGASEAGLDFAVRTAEVIFCVERSLESAQGFYARVLARAAQAGRAAGSIRILPGLSPVIGRTRAEAEAKDRALRDLVPEPLALSYLSDLVQIDLSAYPIDDPIPDLPETNGERSRIRVLLDKLTVAGRAPSIREVALELVQNRGHLRVVGTAVDVADFMQRWFEGQACDGFNILAPMHPQGLSDFVRGVVPILQERGLFRQDYEATSLRGHLGLDRPEAEASRAARPL